MVIPSESGLIVRAFLLTKIMAEGKKSFLLYTDIIHTIDLIDNEQAGVLFKHILNYVNDNNPETTDPIIKILFEPIKQTLKRDLEKWAKDAPIRSAKAKKAGLASAEARQLKETKGNSLVEIELRATKSTVSDSVTVNVKDNVKDNVNVNDSVNRKVTKRGFTPPHYQEISDYFFEKLQSSEQSKFESEKFIDFYASKGWMIGKNKMKDWRAAVRNWIKGIKIEKNGEQGDKFSKEAVKARMGQW